MKGVVTNPKGGGAVDPALRAVRRLSRSQITELGTLVLEQNFDEIFEITHSKTEPALKVMMASVIARSIAKGDAYAMSVVLEQIAGKAKERIDMNVNGNVNQTVEVIDARVLRDPETRKALAVIAEKTNAFHLKKKKSS